MNGQINNPYLMEVMIQEHTRQAEELARKSGLMKEAKRRMLDSAKGQRQVDRFSERQVLSFLPDFIKRIFSQQLPHRE